MTVFIIYVQLCPVLLSLITEQDWAVRRNPFDHIMFQYHLLIGSTRVTFEYVHRIKRSLFFSLYYKWVNVDK